MIINTIDLLLISKLVNVRFHVVTLMAIEESFIFCSVHMLSGSAFSYECMFAYTSLGSTE